jgi:hypothetical protein
VGFEQTRLNIPARLRDQQLLVRYHSGDAETERRAWTVHGVDAAKFIVLDEKTDPGNCEGTTAVAIAHGGNVSPTEAAEAHSGTGGEQWPALTVTGTVGGPGGAPLPATAEARCLTASSTLDGT